MNSQTHQPRDCRIHIGFNFDHLSPDAVRHECTTMFKYCVQRQLQRLFGQECLDRLAETQEPIERYDPKSGAVEMRDVVEWANCRLEGTPGSLRATDPGARVCEWIPCKGWRKIRGLGAESRGRRLTAREAAEEYACMCTDAELPPLTDELREELASLEYTIAVSWEVALPQDPADAAE